MWNGDMSTVRSVLVLMLSVFDAAINGALVPMVVVLMM
jgi:hypothetical protein